MVAAIFIPIKTGNPPHNHSRIIVITADNSRLADAFGSNYNRYILGDCSYFSGLG